MYILCYRKPENSTDCFTKENLHFLEAHLTLTWTGVKNLHKCGGYNLTPCQIRNLWSRMIFSYVNVCTDETLVFIVFFWNHFWPLTWARKLVFFSKFSIAELLKFAKKVGKLANIGPKRRLRKTHEDKSCCKINFTSNICLVHYYTLCSG